MEITPLMDLGIINVVNKNSLDEKSLIIFYKRLLDNIFKELEDHVDTRKNRISLIIPLLLNIDKKYPFINNGIGWSYTAQLLKNMAEIMFKVNFTNILTFSMESLEENTMYLINMDTLLKYSLENIENTDYGNSYYTNNYCQNVVLKKYNIYEY